MSTPLHALLEHAHLWRGEACARAVPALPSGFAALDACLPGSGWPKGALTELLLPLDGIGEFALVMPACARLTESGRWVVFVAPPYIPYAPALAAAGLDLSRLLMIKAETHADKLWALEQALKSPQCGAALAWPKRLDPRSLRRLQLACETSEASAFLFLPEAAAANASTAALRLRLAPAEAGSLEVHVLKRRGGVLERPLRIDPRQPR
jgi:hypothetical protein